MEKKITITKKLLRFISEQGILNLLSLIFDKGRNFFNVKFKYRGLTLKNGYVGPRSIIRGMKFIKIGRNFYSKDMLWLDAVSYYLNFNFSPYIEIGDNVSFSRNVHIGATGKIKIGNGVMIGSNVLISDHQHGYYEGSEQSAPTLMPSKRPLSSGNSIVIEDNSWIGDGVTILPGVKVGEGSIVGANSVVSRSLPPYTINVGCPAVSIKAYNSQTKKWEKLAKDKNGF